MTPIDPKPLTVRQAADRLGVHKQTLYRLCWDNVLRYFKVGTRIRIEPSVIEDYIKSTTVDPVCFAS